MYKFLANNGQGLAFGAGMVITVLFLLFVVLGMDSFNTLSDDERVNTTIFDFGLYATLALTAIAVVALVGFGLYQVASNFKSSIKGVIGVALLVGIFVVSYVMASDQPEHQAIADSVERVGGVTGGQLKFIGGSIITSLILSAGAILAFVGSEIRNFFK